MPQNMNDRVIIKQWGLQRSGTNLTKWLLKNNFKDIDIYENKMSWKHSVPSNIEEFKKYAKPFDRQPNFHIVTVRDPYSWFYSFTKYCDRKPPTLPSNFPIYSSNPNNTQTIMNLWDKYICEYIDFVDEHDNSYLVNYKELVLNPQTTLLKIQDKFSLRKKQGLEEFKVSEKGVDPHMKGVTIDVSFFLSEKYLEKIAVEEQEIITNTISEKAKSIFYETAMH